MKDEIIETAMEYCKNHAECYSNEKPRTVCPFYTNPDDNCHTIFNLYKALTKVEQNFDKAINKAKKDTAKAILQDIKQSLPQGYIALCIWISGQAEKYGVKIK